MPVFVDERTLVSFVLNRRGRDFSDRERDVLDLTRPALAGLFGTFRCAGRAERGAGAPAGAALTPREREVMRWLGAGKTDRDIGSILGCSHRTVQKHLQRIYEKLASRRGPRPSFAGSTRGTERLGVACEGDGTIGACPPS